MRLNCYRTLEIKALGKETIRDMPEKLIQCARFLGDIVQY